MEDISLINNIIMIRTPNKKKFGKLVKQLTNKLKRDDDFEMIFTVRSKVKRKVKWVFLGMMHLKLENVN